MGRALRLDYAKYGHPGTSLVGYRYSPSQYPPGTHPVCTTPGTPPLTVTAVHVLGMLSREVKLVVGLISVDQLSLSVLISGFRTMTEVYNLRNIGRINNH